MFFRNQINKTASSLILDEENVALDLPLWKRFGIGLVAVMLNLIMSIISFVIFYPLMLVVFIVMEFGKALWNCIMSFPEFIKDRWDDTSADFAALVRIWKNEHGLGRMLPKSEFRKPIPKAEVKDFND